MNATATMAPDVPEFPESLSMLEADCLVSWCPLAESVTAASLNHALDVARALRGSADAA